jgi:general secretion pathway protein D
MKLQTRRKVVAAVVALAFVLSGCAARNAYRRGQSEARKGNWDLAVAKLTLALQKDPGNIPYKMALENARIQASRYHYDLGRKAMAAQELDKAADELEIAWKYDPANKSASDDLAIVQTKIRKRDEEKKRLSEFEEMKSRVQAARLPLPVLSPRSPVPITLKFTETSLQKIFDTLSKLAGVNILFDEGFRDKKVDVNLSGVTFQEALDQITFVNRLFYKVLNQNTLIIVPESPQKRRAYDEQIVRTFYLQNAEANDVLNLVKTLANIQKALANKELAAITVLGTPDKVALAEKIIEANDKAKGEVMIEVQILEVNRTNAKNYGIELSQYEVQSAFTPFGGNETQNGFTSLRAHMLSSINLSDFVVSIPSTLFARFLQTDSTVRILASPRLRAAEGKKTELKIGTEVPIPVTTFTAGAQGGTSTFLPATSFQYRNVGVNLTLTPKVNPSGDMTLEVSAEFSLLGDDRNVGSGANPLVVPTFLTRNITGIIRLRDGETSLLGGLLQDREASALKGALGIQSIPILNKIFTSAQKRSEESEVLISLTPHVLRAPKVTDEDLEPLFVGTEEVPRVLGARPPLFGPEEPPSKPETPPGPGAAGPPSLQRPSLAAPGAPRPVTPTPVTPTPVPPAEAPVPEAAPGAAAAAGPGQGPTRPVNVLLSPPETAVKVGEQVTVSVVVVGARDLTSVELDLAYNPSLLEAVDVAAGSLLTLDGTPLGSEKALDPGRVHVKFTRASAAAGSGVVASVTFKGRQEGPAVLTLDSLALTTSSGTERPTAPAPGRVVVTQ